MKYIISDYDDKTVIDVNNCLKCPFAKRYIHFKKEVNLLCKKNNERWIRDVDEIPEWCPLPDAKKIDFIDIDL